jgi:hypothetical protein
MVGNTRGVEIRRSNSSFQSAYSEKIISEVLFGIVRIINSNVSKDDHTIISPDGFLDTLGWGSPIMNPLFPLLIQARSFSVNEVFSTQFSG